MILFPEEIRELILQMAKDTPWGYTRILGEFKKLQIHNISRSTVARILKENGFDPGPKRGNGTWHEFVCRHFSTLWATDFFTKTVWTLRGPVTYYVLFFIHIQTRRVHIAGVTPNPDGAWMAQQARNMSMVFDEEPDEYKPTYIIRDRDSKFTQQFRRILKRDGIEFRKIAPMSPNRNPFAEGWVQRTKHEVLDHFIVFGEQHLRHLLKEWLAYYHEFRPHQGLGNVPISGFRPRTEDPIEFRREEVTCHERLGGLLKHYERKVARVNTVSWADASPERGDADSIGLACNAHCNQHAQRCLAPQPLQYGSLSRGRHTADLSAKSVPNDDRSPIVSARSPV